MVACFVLQRVICWSRRFSLITFSLFWFLLSLSIDFLNNDDKFIMIENLYNCRFISRGLYSSCDELLIQQIMFFPFKIFILIIFNRGLGWLLLIWLAWLYNFGLFRSLRCLENKFFVFVEAKEFFVNFLLFFDYETNFWLIPRSLFIILFWINWAMLLWWLFRCSLLLFQPNNYNDL